ncbi:MAG: hypothetical protein F6K09_13125 [Merismopedia sp. SIO2A8]|nr:hypothetical protein [Merismopedia sp. SIO2A8]
MFRLGLPSSTSGDRRCYQRKTIRTRFAAIIPRYLMVSGVLLSGALITGCQQSTVARTPRTFTVEQDWELSPGNLVAGYRISGGLGDVSIDLKGRPLYAPFAGTLQLHKENCAVFSSPEVPAYLLRFCDIQKPQLGDLLQGERIGVSQTLQFAALRKQPTGEWTIVEPAQDILERVLTPSP